MIRQEEIPGSVRVGAFTYAIDTFPPMMGTKENRIGECFNLPLEIKYQSDLPEQKIAAVLVHEILHALWYVSGLHREFGENQEEHVLRLENALCAFIVDNPHFFAWVSQTLSEEGAPTVLEAVPVGSDD